MEGLTIRKEEYCKLSQIRACANSVRDWTEIYKESPTETNKFMVDSAIERLIKYTTEYDNGIYTTD